MSNPRLHAAALALMLLTASTALAQDCGPGSTFPALADTGAWNWCQDPKAVTHVGEHGRTYTGWVTMQGSIVVAHYDHETGEIVTSTLHERLERDDHDNPVFEVLADGRITAYYSPHGGARKRDVVENLYYRTSRRPESAATWDVERTIAVNTEGPWGWTYPNVATLEGEGSDGRTYVFWRGGNGLPSFSSTDDEGDSWARAASLVESDGVRPYLKLVSDGDTSIHFAFTDGHPRGDPTNSLYYCRYEGGAFYRADGSLVAGMEHLPFHARETDRVYDARVDSVRAWVWDVALDENGYPVIAYVNFPDFTEHHYRYARWNGSAWEDHELCPAGGYTGIVDEARRIGRAVKYYSGGIALDHTDPSVVYLASPVDGVFEIERWWTTDGGATWESEPVTCGSEFDNIRPVVPRDRVPGGPDVFWMHGTYNHYRWYETSIRMRVPSQQP